MRRFHVLLLVPVATVMGCASTTPPPVANPSGGRPQTTRVVGAAGISDLRTNPTLARRTVKIEFPFAKVMAALPGVYEKLGIPVTTTIPHEGVIANDGLKLRRKLGDMALSRYIDCGSGQGMPSADTYEIFMTIRTQVQPAEGGSTATTIMEAQGRPVSISGDYIKCSTTGRLEDRIGQMLGGTPPK